MSKSNSNSNNYNYSNSGNNANLTPEDKQIRQDRRKAIFYSKKKKLSKKLQGVVVTPLSKEQRKTLYSKIQPIYNARSHDWAKSYDSIRSTDIKSLIKNNKYDPTNKMKYLDDIFHFFPLYMLLIPLERYIKAYERLSKKYNYPNVIFKNKQLTIEEEYKEKRILELLMYLNYIISNFIHVSQILYIKRFSTNDLTDIYFRPFDTKMRFIDFYYYFEIANKNIDEHGKIIFDKEKVKDDPKYFSNIKEDAIQKAIQKAEAYIKQIEVNKAARRNRNELLSFSIKDALFQKQLETSPGAINTILVKATKKNSGKSSGKSGKRRSSESSNSNSNSIAIDPELEKLYTELQINENFPMFLSNDPKEKLERKPRK